MTKRASHAQSTIVHSSSPRAKARKIGESAATSVACVHLYWYERAASYTMYSGCQQRATARRYLKRERA